MPKIPGFGPTNISMRVPGANLSSAGVGATARALGQLGQEGATMATQLLAERKDFQATMFAKEQVLAASQERQNFRQENRNKLDPATGLMPDGRQWIEWVEEHEETLRNNFADTAPTELAKRRFLTNFVEGSQKRLLEEDTYQHEVMIKYSDEQITEQARVQGNKFRVAEEGTLFGSFHDVALDTEASIEELVGKTYNRSQADAKILQMNALQGAALLERAKNLNDIDTMMYELRVPLSRPEKQEILRAKVKELLKPHEQLTGQSIQVGRLVEFADGSMAYEITRGEGSSGPGYYFIGKNELVSKKEMTSHKFKYVDNKPVFDMEEAIPVDGVVPQRKRVADYFTPAQNDAYIDSLFNMLEGKQRENLSKLNANQKHLVDALSSTNEITKLRKTDPVVMGQIIDQVANIEAQVVAPEDRASMYRSLGLAISFGETMDKLPRQSPEQISQSMQQLNKQADDFINTLGEFIPADVMTPQFMAGLREDYLNKIQYAAEKLQQDRFKDPALYVNTHFSEIRGLKEKTMQGNISQQALAQAKYADEVRRLEDFMGVPDYLKSPAGLSKGEIDSMAKSFQAEVARGGSEGARIGAETLSTWKVKYGDDYPTVINAMKKEGLSDKYTYAAILPLDTEIGLRDATQIINNTKARYYDVLDADSRAKVDAAVFKEIQKYNKAFTTNYNFGDDVIASKTLFNIVSDEAARRVFESGTDKEGTFEGDVEEAASEAVKLVNRHFTNVSTNSSSVNLSNRMMSDNNITPELAEDALDVAEDKEFIYGMIDPRKTFTEQLRLEVIGITDPVKQEDFIRRTILSQEFIARVDEKGNLYPSIRVGGNTITLKNKQGRDLKIPMAQWGSFVETRNRQ